MRVNHVLLITSVAGAWLTRDAASRELHIVFGYCALGLVSFRLVWGVVAKGHARFATFAYGPHAVLRYLRGALGGAPLHYTGHNPAGSWSVFGLLALVGATAIAGVLAIGGMQADGPATGLLGFEWTDRMREWHEQLAWAVLILALLHVLGVAWGSRVHRENLAAAMVTGTKTTHDGSGDAPRHAAMGAAVAIAAFGFAAFDLAVLEPRDRQQRRQDEERFKAESKLQVWSVECRGCHLAYAPGTLPARSWERMLAGQNEHFGEDLGLSAAKITALRAAFSSAPVPGWKAWKLQRSAPAGSTPMRFSEIRYWRRAHEDLPERAFKPPASAGHHDCEACHADAHSGIFHPRMIHIPKAGVGS